MLSKLTAGKWLIHGTKHHKNNQLQSLEPPVEYSSWENQFYINDSVGNTLNTIFHKNARGTNILGVEQLQYQNYIFTESINPWVRRISMHFVDTTLKLLDRNVRVYNGSFLIGKILYYDLS